MVVRAGVIGLGWMGGGMALCLARAGRPLSVYDVNPDAPSRWQEGHILPSYAKSCSEVAQESDVVVVVVVDAAQIHTVMHGPHGLLAGAHKDLAIVIASTVSMPELTEICAGAASFGVSVVDCGVSSPPGGHDKKRIISMVGAEAAVFEKVKPVLEDFSQLVLHMGSPGAGMATKIIRNMAFYSTWYAACEAGKIAELAGIDTGKIAQIDHLSLADDCGSTVWFRRWSERKPDDAPRTTQDHVRALMLKDLDAAVELMKALGQSNPLIDLMRANADQITRPMR